MYCILSWEFTYPTKRYLYKKNGTQVACCLHGKSHQKSCSIVHSCMQLICTGSIRLLPGCHGGNYTSLSQAGTCARLVARLDSASPLLSDRSPCVETDDRITGTQHSCVKKKHFTLYQLQKIWRNRSYSTSSTTSDQVVRCSHNSRSSVVRSLRRGEHCFDFLLYRDLVDVLFL